MRLIVLFMFLSQITHSQNDIYNREYEYVLTNKEFLNYSFRVYDTTFNSTIENHEKLKNFELFKQSKNNRLQNKILSSKSIIDTFFQAKNEDIDSLILNSRLKISDYEVITQIHAYLNDSINVGSSIIEKHEGSLDSILSSIILDKHKGIDYFRGITYSKVIWYGKFGVQIMKKYNFSFPSNRPLYLILVVYKKNLFGKIKQKEVRISEQLN